MTKKPATNVGTSVRARLLNLARERGVDFQLLMLRYLNERLLYRLSNSRYSSRFVLKGASLFLAWTGIQHRVTRDVDLLGFGDASEAKLAALFREVLAGPGTPEDGVTFDVDSIEVGPIRDGQEYGGLRVELVGCLTTARVRLVVDVGFGDSITPDAEDIEFPTLLEAPPPVLRAYPKESVIAEKFEAMVSLGLANSRMKDFYDVAFLAREFEFERGQLVAALRATFDRRRTELPIGTPTAWTPDFFEDVDKQRQWSGFVRKSGVHNAASLAETIAAVQAFLAPAVRDALENSHPDLVWCAGGPWTARRA